MNAIEIEQAISELVEREVFDAKEFPFQFLETFGNKATTINRLKSGNTNKSDIDGAFLQRSNIHLSVVPVGEVGSTLKALRESPQTEKQKAQFILATDGEDLEAEDLSSGETVACSYKDFPNHFGFFLPLAGISTVRAIRENPIDIQATSRLNRLYVELLKENPDWDTDKRREDMNQFMARLIFCFFAEDTNIFKGDNLFTSTIEQMSDSRSGNITEVISELFRAMDISYNDRPAAKLRSWAEAFPYVNGGLFAGNREVPKFTRIARSYLLHAGNLNWKEINPDIFGSMIQAVADDEERGALGMHYTSVPNILKVLNPLFLDDLRETLEEAGNNARKLLNLRKRISKIRVFDPACGSGNFLVIAYKEMRAIEFEINQRRDETHLRSEMPLTNFRGIEIREFPAEVARLALIIAEYQCDEGYLGQKQALDEFLPLESQNWIICGNALRLDWLAVCPSTGALTKQVSEDLFETPLEQPEIDFENEGGETYICGNPPYVGGKKLNAQQKEDMNSCGLGALMQLDYVCCWLSKFVQYNKTHAAVASFVCTSSICQGEQIGLIWPFIKSGSVEIRFCHQAFYWKNNAQNNANVTCVILGLGSRSSKRKIIYSEKTKREVENINPYLVSGRDIYVMSVSSPLNGLPPMCMGSNPVDGKNLVLSGYEREEFVSTHPESSAFIRRYLGGTDIISGKLRYCLWIPDASVESAKGIPPIQNRISQCQIYRRGAGRDAKKTADVPHRFCYRTHQDADFIALPKTTSSTRKYLPLDVFKSGAVVNVDAFSIYDGKLFVFSLLSSLMHNVWLAVTSGRLTEGYRYSVKLSYNNLPLPKLTEKNKADLARCAEDILLAREAHFPATIADLYDPERMPGNLRAAHERNDEVLERIYIGRRFKNDTERLEKLFELYTKMTSPETAKEAS